MNTKTLAFAILLICVATGAFAVESATPDAAPATAGPENAPPALTTVLAPEPVYEFPPVLDGDEVVHDFIIQNKGQTEISIDRVRTG